MLIFAFMKTVIFAGGIGSRISEESHLRPKPMIEIGEKPILWHIMKIYASQGFHEFIICLGYKGYMIKEYFMNYFMHNSDVTVDIARNKIEIHETKTESFKVTLVDTGLHTQTAGRLKRIRHHVGNDDFMLTYGDGLADVSIHELIKFHKSHGKIATMTVVQPEGKFGALDFDNDGLVTVFNEKPRGDRHWINGGFFVLDRRVFKYLSTDPSCSFEKEPLQMLAADGELMMFEHTGFWSCLDTMRDLVHLNQLWETGDTPWIKKSRAGLTP